jgi:hypothetical protein
MPEGEDHVVVGWAFGGDTWCLPCADRLWCVIKLFAPPDSEARAVVVVEGQDQDQRDVRPADRQATIPPIE